MSDRVKMMFRDPPYELPTRIMPSHDTPVLTDEERELRRARFESIGLMLRALDPTFDDGAYRYSELIGEAIARLGAEYIRISDKQGATDNVYNLEGDINVGDSFIWEPLDPKAREWLVVTNIIELPDDERKIESENARGQRCWNDESRFREACVRVKNNFHGTEK